jgi:hypothetical protein
MRLRWADGQDCDTRRGLVARVADHCPSAWRKDRTVAVFLSAKSRRRRILVKMSGRRTPVHTAYACARCAEGVASVGSCMRCMPSPGGPPRQHLRSVGRIRSRRRRACRDPIHSTRELVVRCRNTNGANVSGFAVAGVIPCVAERPGRCHRRRVLRRRVCPSLWRTPVPVRRG